MLRENSIIRNAAVALMDAINSGDKDKANQALENYGKAIADSVQDTVIIANGDKTVLAQRGIRQLTTQEERYYNTIAKAGLSDNPKQYLNSLTDQMDKVMPTTIIEDVFKDIISEHPLLDKINFQTVEYLTRWILNDHSKDTAVWGDINDSVVKQIQSAFRVVEISQKKLSAYTLIEREMLKLGPVFLDTYIRTFIKEALLAGLEKGIICGTGKNEPIGFDRDIHKGVSVTDGAYPQKSAIKVTSFAPKEYGNLLSRLAVSEVWYTKNEDDTIVDASTAANADGSAKPGYTKHGGKMRKFYEVTMICNMVDYLNKIMPATTVLNTAATYTNNVFPFPTDVIVSNEIKTGKAEIVLPLEYFLGIGTPKEGVIEFSDDVKFFEDQRAFKGKITANGMPYDNTVSILIDIEDLDPAYITVLNKTETQVA